MDKIKEEVSLFTDRDGNKMVKTHRGEIMKVLATNVVQEVDEGKDFYRVTIELYCEPE